MKSTYKKQHSPFAPGLLTKNSNPNNPFFMPAKSDKNLNWQQAKRKYPNLKANRDYDNDGFPNSKDCKPLDHSRDGIMEAIGGLFTKKNSPSESRFSAMKRGFTEGMREPNVVQRYQARRQQQQVSKVAKQTAVTRSLPGVTSSPYHMQQARKEQAAQPYRNLKALAGAVYRLRPENKLTRAMSSPQGFRQVIRSARPVVVAGSRERLPKKLTKMMYPGQIPASATLNIARQETHGPRRPGRPPGSVKFISQRTGQPIGVYEYRKEQRALKRMARDQQMYAQVRAMQQYPKMVAQRAYNQQIQAQQQVIEQQQPQQYEQPAQQYEQPQPQYQQPQQYPQYPQQMPQQPQQRVIGTIFKSAGGSPYPPVNRQPLQATNQTIPQGFVEVVDSFTGRRYYKPLPRKESWIS